MNIKNTCVQEAHKIINDKRVEYDAKYYETTTAIANLKKKYNHIFKRWTPDDKQEHERLEKLSSSLDYNRERFRNVCKILQADIQRLESDASFEKTFNKIARAK